MRYINEILVNWEITEKEADLICEAIRLGLEDASCGSREISRLAYINIYGLYPKKAEKLKQCMPSAQLRNRLIKAEKEAQELKQAAAAATSAGGADEFASRSRSRSRSGGDITSSSSFSSSSLNHSAHSTNDNASSGSSLMGAGHIGHMYSYQQPVPLRHLPAKTLGKKVEKDSKKGGDKRMSFHTSRVDPRETAAACIQAVFRGMLTRKLLPEIIEAFRESYNLSSNYQNNNDNYQNNNGNVNNSNVNNSNVNNINNGENNFNIINTSNYMNTKNDTTTLLEERGQALHFTTPKTPRYSGDWETALQIGGDWETALQIGDVVTVAVLASMGTGSGGGGRSTPTAVPVQAQVKFVGDTAFAPGLWIGIQFRAQIGK